MKNSLSTVQYAFFGFNWIVGFGFISALSVVSKIGPWVFLCFIIAEFIAFITMIVFARAAEEYSHIAGGTYGYSKLVFGRFLTFFQGWNQFSHIFLLSATAPLFLASLLKMIDRTPEHKIYYKAGSVLFFILLTLISIFSLKYSKIVLFIFGIAKYIIILLGTLFLVYFFIKDKSFIENLKSNNKVTITMITEYILLFVFSFNGFNNLVALSRDTVKFTKFKKKQW